MPAAPGPRRSLFMPTLFFAKGGPLRFLEGLARDHGDVVRFHLGVEEVWLLNRPDLVQDVLVTHAAKFRKGRALERARLFLGDGLLTSEGADHRRQRRLLQPAFHRARLTGYGATMVEAAERASARWKEGETLAFDREMMRLTLDIVSRTLFSADVTGEARAIGDALTTLLEGFNRLLLPFAPLLMKLPLRSSRELRAAQATLEATLRRLIAERRAHGGTDTGDLLSMLLLAEDADKPGERLSDGEIRDQALTLFIAGHETTAVALAWTFHLLALHPEAERALHAEVDAVLGNRIATFGDLPALPVVERTVRESLRLRPPAWVIGRRTVERHEIDGFVLRPGALVLVSPWVLQRDARYHERPLEFRPERWSEPSAEKLPKFAYFPFGGGARTCIGEGFAWAELILVVATLARRWRFRHAADAAEVTPLPRLTLRLRSELHLVAERRPEMRPA